MSESRPEDLCDYVQRQLPLRAKLLGKQRLDAVTMSAIRHWPAEQLLAGCSSEDGGEAVGRTAIAVFGECRSADPKRYGSVVLSMLLMWLASAVVQMLLKWWLERSSNRVKMTAWQQELKGKS